MQGRKKYLLEVQHVVADNSVHLILCCYYSIVVLTGSLVDYASPFPILKLTVFLSGSAGNSTSSDLNVGVSLDELQNDVICAPHLPQDAKDLSRAPIERCQSEELPCLRSILKRSSSESNGEMLDEVG